MSTERSILGLCLICGSFGGKIRFTPGNYLQCDRCQAILVPGLSRPVELTRREPSVSEQKAPKGYAGEGAWPELSAEEQRICDDWAMRPNARNHEPHPLCHRWYGLPVQHGPNKYTEYRCRFCTMTALWPERS